MRCWLALLSILVGGCAGAARHPATAVPAAGSGLSGPCGTVSRPGAYTHVIWIWMENHSAGSVVGSSQAPYVDSLVAGCGSATNYHNISHPSLPNYIAATSGLGLAGLGAFSGDCSPSRSCSTAAPSIFGQGEGWRAYEETMPAPCARSNSGAYAVRHNPPPYYSTLPGCQTSDVPFGQFAPDLAAGRLPAFSFVTPDVIDDMHDGTVAEGDAWLRQWMGAIVSSRLYRSGGVAVFVTWDEGEGGTSADCATNTTDAGCRVATIVVSPSTVPGTRSPALFNHYSLLATTEDLLGLPRLGEAGAAPAMIAAFNL